MKNIVSVNDKSEIIMRVNKLAPKQEKLWGKMNVNEMVCHCSDQILMATGDVKSKFIGSPIQKHLLKRLILLGMPIPKGKIETSKELNQDKEGTKPTEFNNDKNILIKLIDEFDQKYDSKLIVVHPAFGDMNKTQWARMVWLHLDHHLKQFGV